MAKKTKTKAESVDSETKDGSLDADQLAGWQTFDPKTYKDVASKLVHFSTKTVNSNATAGGVRLGPTDGLDFPYLSARTLLSSGTTLDLDYTTNSGSTARVVKQMYAARDGKADNGQLSESEKAAINEGFKVASSSAFETGLTQIDARLRQILVPNQDAPGGYVSLTPLTAGGICQLLLDTESGLVSKHNKQFKDERAQQKNKAENSEGIAESKRRFITQARFGIGGSNPQNVGKLVRSMQRPILLQSPNSAASSRFAFSLYYKGIRFDTRSLKQLQPEIEEYKKFRDRNSVDGNIQSLMGSRDEEKTVMYRICDKFLEMGDEALETLLINQSILPREFTVSGSTEEFELVSRDVPGVIRGFIDPRLRGMDYSKVKSGVEIDWPRAAALLIVSHIAEFKSSVKGETVHLAPLDTAARSSLASILEEYLR